MYNQLGRISSFGLLIGFFLSTTACMTDGSGESDPESGTGSISGEAAAGIWTQMGSLTGVALSGVDDGELAFPNDSVGFLCLGEDPKTDRMRWLRSGDAGKSWAAFGFDTAMSLESLYGFGNSVAFGQADYFVKKASGSVSTVHRVLRTGNAGESWEFLTVEGDSSLDDFEAQSNGVLWVEKSKAKYFSLDTAKTWKKFEPGPTVQSHLAEGYYLLDETKGAGIFFASALAYDLAKDTYSKHTIPGIAQAQGLAMTRSGWGVAGGFAMNTGTGAQTPLLAQTRDGKSWQALLGEGNGFFFTVSLLAEKTAMAIGVSGATSLLNYRSEDGGVIWKKVPASGIPMLLGITCPSEKVCFGYAHTNAIYRYNRE